MAGQQVQNKFTSPRDPMKHFFLHIVQVAFCGGQKAENEFVGLGDHRNIAFST
jgi:hypothetical protein